MTGSHIRSLFLDYFAAQGHQKVHSSSLVPAHDPTLLFTNAGMNQFKDVFLGRESRDYQRATTAQKCLRAGGKHNDLETVGFTNRHHTFFEMLGNFSFGDYFKKEAIAFAWDLMTSPQWLGLEKDRLYATVFTSDDEAYEIWRRQIQLPAERIFRLGEKENFWAMGETGPCGPCSEIHIDLGSQASSAGHADCAFPCECGRYVELWNLVFMQYDRDSQGRLNPLPRPSIDTGAGLERLTAILQGKTSNYDTDLFQPIIQTAEKLAGTTYGRGALGRGLNTDISLRILADHARAGTFLIADGVAPANEGRGYVLRKILRRAIRHGRLLGIEGAFLQTLADAVIGEMSAAYPELDSARGLIERTLSAEEDRFTHTLQLAMKELDHARVRMPDGGIVEFGNFKTQLRGPDQRVAHGNAPVILGEGAFKLYDTFGLPWDLLAEIAGERGFEVDRAGFDAAMEEQRQKARASWKGAEKSVANPVYQQLAEASPTRFEGYETLASDGCKLIALIRNGRLVDSAQPGEMPGENAGETLEAVLDHTPFYAASGGQIGDRGIFAGASGHPLAQVLDTYAPVSGLTVHRIQLLEPLKTGAMVRAEVDPGRRAAARRNHTATHLLHAALRSALGTHVKQAGSVVDPEHLRFDFSHFAPVGDSELEEIEARVNREIWSDTAVQTEVLPLEQALATGAMALFGEKYRAQVRVVSIGDFSRELCGGTHCARTGEIGSFRIVSEASVAAGTRRIEALTGEAAWRQAREQDRALRRLGQLLHSSGDQIPQQVETLVRERQRLEQELDRARMKAAQSGSASQRRHIQGVQVLALRCDQLGRAQLRQLLDENRQKLGSGVVALGSLQEDGKTALLVGVTPDLIPRLPAGKIVKSLPGITGGGRADLAEAGGREPARLDEQLEAVYAVVEQMLLKNGN